MKKIILIFLLSSNFMFCSKDSPSEPEPTLTEKLQKALDDGLESFNGKGVSAAVIMPDGETWIDRKSVV